MQQVYPVYASWTDQSADTETNLEDNGDSNIGRYGGSGKVSGTRQTHFSAGAQRGIIAQKIAEKIVTTNGYNTLLQSAYQSDSAEVVTYPGYNAGRNSLPSFQGWSVNNESLTTVSSDTTDTTQGFALNVTPTNGVIFDAFKPIFKSQFKALWQNGGVLRFKIRPNVGTSPGTSKYLT